MSRAVQHLQQEKWIGQQQQEVVVRVKMVETSESVDLGPSSLVLLWDVGPKPSSCTSAVPSHMQRIIEDMNRREAKQIIKRIQREARGPGGTICD